MDYKRKAAVRTKFAQHPVFVAQREEMYVPAAQAIRNTRHLREQYRAMLEFQGAMYRLSIIVREIDLLAKECKYGSLQAKTLATSRAGGGLPSRPADAPAQQHRGARGRVSAKDRTDRTHSGQIFHFSPIGNFDTLMQSQNSHAIQKKDDRQRL